MARRENFDELTDIYEALVDWPQRLAREEPFYRRWFQRVGVESLVDVACGTGRHAAMFRSWGLRVEAADVSTAMLQRARAQRDQEPGLRWVLRGFDQPIGWDVPFDAAICVGNSLALAADRGVVQRCLREMFAAVRRGGVVVVHLLNLWRLPDGPSQWQKCRLATLPSGDVAIVKGVHRAGSRGFLDLIVVPLAPAGDMQTHTTQLLGLQQSDLQQLAGEAGASEVRFFGGYDDQVYEPDQSVDLIMAAIK